MAADTKIEWATHSFSPWLGCTKVASGCANCYASDMAGRLGVTWGPNGTRRRTAASTWKQVEKWNRQAACTCGAMLGKSHMDAFATCPQCSGNRPRVFPSLCDPFEDWQGPILNGAGVPCVVPDRTEVVAGSPANAWKLSTMDDVRRDFFALINRTPNLDWLLLTKRPENIRRMWPHRVFGMQGGYQAVLGSADHPGGLWRPNVWLLYSASDQQSLEAGLPHLLACRDLAPVLGLSLEPLIAPVDLNACWPGGMACGDGPYVRGLDWVIIGGESGPRARPMELAWLESIAKQCAAAGVPLFVKQDCGRKPGQQGRIPDSLWARKELPKC